MSHPASEPTLPPPASESTGPTPSGRGPFVLAIALLATGLVMAATFAVLIELLREHTEQERAQAQAQLTETDRQLQNAYAKLLRSEQDCQKAEAAHKQALADFVRADAARQKVENDLGDAEKRGRDLDGLLKTALTQKALTRANLGRALDAFEHTTDRLSAKDVAAVAHLVTLRRQVLEDMLPVYDALLADKDGDPAATVLVARAHRGTAVVRELLSQPDPSFHRQRARQLLGDLLKGDKDDAAAGYQLALLDRDAARLQRQAGKPTAALEALAPALRRLEKLAADHPREAAYRDELAECLLVQGVLLDGLAKTDDGEKALAEAGRLAEELRKEAPNDRRARALLAGVNLERGEVALVGRANPQEAEGYFRAALEQYTYLLRAVPDDPLYRIDEGAVLLRLASALREQGKAGAAEPFLERARESYAGLVAEFPAVTDYRRRLAGALHNLGLVYRATHRHREAEGQFRAALRLMEQVLKEPEPTPADRRDEAQGWLQLGRALAATGRLPDAEEALGKARERFAGLTKEAPNDVELLQDQATALENLGTVQRRRGRLPEARTSLDAAHALLTKLVQKTPTVMAYRRDLAAVTHDLGEVLREAKKEDEAVKAFKEALKLRQELVKEFRNDPRHLFALARTTAALGDHDEAARVAAALPRLNDDKAQGNYDAACTLVFCARAAEREGGKTEDERQAMARRYLDRAMRFLREAVKAEFADLDALRHDEDLAPLRGRDDFKKLVSEVEGKAKK